MKTTIINLLHELDCGFEFILAGFKPLHRKKSSVFHNLVMEICFILFIFIIPTTRREKNQNPKISLQILSELSLSVGETTSRRVDRRRRRQLVYRCLLLQILHRWSL